MQHTERETDAGYAWRSLPKMIDDDPFDYHSDMREYYQSDDVAEEYHDAFAAGGNWRHRLIAERERKAILTLLHEVPSESVLDIPTGTGKLAPIFAETGSKVLACDVSQNMLRLAEEEYARAGVEEASFEVCDAEEISNTIDNTFDVAVCLRLLHRVPADVKRQILSELGTVADFVIASTGVETPFHKFRRNLRQVVLGGDERNHCYESPAATKTIFSEHFDIVRSKRVLPVLSQEWVYLLDPDE